MRNGFVLLSVLFVFILPVSGLCTKSFVVAVFTQLLAPAERVAGAQDHQSILSARYQQQRQDLMRIWREKHYTTNDLVAACEGRNRVFWRRKIADVSVLVTAGLGDESHYMIHQAYFDGRKSWGSRLLLEANLKPRCNLGTYERNNGINSKERAVKLEHFIIAANLGEDSL